MKETVWFSACYNEIWVKTSSDRIERGSQALLQIPGLPFSVQDHLSFFFWLIDLETWKKHIQKGWLIKLGYLD